MLDAVATRGFKTGLQAVVFVKQLLHIMVAGLCQGMLDLPHACAHFEDVREGITPLFANGAVAVKPCLLREVCDLKARRKRERAGAWALQSRDNAENGRLSRPIRAD